MASFVREASAVFGVKAAVEHKEAAFRVAGALENAAAEGKLAALGVAGAIEKAAAEGKEAALGVAGAIEKAAAEGKEATLGVAGSLVTVAAIMALAWIGSSLIKGPRTDRAGRRGARLRALSRASIPRRTLTPGRDGRRRSPPPEPSREL